MEFGQKQRRKRWKIVCWRLYSKMMFGVDHQKVNFAFIFEVIFLFQPNVKRWLSMCRNSHTHTPNKHNTLCVGGQQFLNIYPQKMTENTTKSLAKTFHCKLRCILCQSGTVNTRSLHSSHTFTHTQPFFVSSSSFWTGNHVFSVSVLENVAKNSSLPCSFAQFKARRFVLISTDHV